MVWFKVDDSLHSHPKALAASLAAIGLWSLAGSWSGKHRTDGFVSDQAVSQLSRGEIELATELVKAGLWKRCKGGYRFHEWDQRNPTRSHDDRIADRKASGGALGNHLRWHAKTGKQNPDCHFCQEKQASDHRSVSDRSTDRTSDRIPNPDPTRPEGSTSYSNTSPGWEEFWEAYPRKEGKKPAEGAYAKAIKKPGVTPELLIERATSYAKRCGAEGRPREKIKMAQGWLNDERWNDENATTVQPMFQRAKFAWEN